MSMVCAPQQIVNNSIVSVVKTGVPFRFHVEPKAGPGRQDVVVAKAYTKSVNVLPSNRVKLEIEGLNGPIRAPETYYYLKDNVLYAKKKFRHEVSNSFALNYRLAIELDWDVCFIVSKVSGEEGEFVASRREWMANGRVDENGEELQLAMEVEQYRILPSGRLLGGLTDEEVVSWIHSC